MDTSSGLWLRFQERAGTRRLCRAHPVRWLWARHLVI